MRNGFVKKKLSVRIENYMNCCKKNMLYLHILRQKWKLCMKFTAAGKILSQLSASNGKCIWNWSLLLLQKENVHIFRLNYCCNGETNVSQVLVNLCFLQLLSEIATYHFLLLHLTFSGNHWFTKLWKHLVFEKNSTKTKNFHYLKSWDTHEI